MNSRTKEGFIDGAVFHNNSVRIASYESKLIWPEVKEYHPDILLSLGTGHNGADTDGFVVPNRSGSATQRRSLGIRGFPDLNSWIKLAVTRLDNILDSEAIWRLFKKDALGSSSYLQARRYVRLNPRIGFRTPKMENNSQVDKLQEDVRSHLQTPPMRAKVAGIAHQLIASCFYFERSEPTREADDHYIVQGELTFTIFGTLLLQVPIFQTNYEPSHILECNFRINRFGYNTDTLLYSVH